MTTDLWTVECGVFLIDMPFARHSSLQNTLEFFLRLIPHLKLSHPLLGIPRGQSHSEVEPKRFVDRFEEVKGSFDFPLDLFSRAEDVS